MTLNVSGNKMVEAKFWKKLDEEKQVVRCFLCPRKCVIKPGEFGLCGARKNVEGTLYSATYGKVASIALDPIEKKPLYHFFPGREILSIGTAGCNFECPWCQNFEIAQANADNVPLRDVTAEELLGLAKRYNSIGIAYTYNEPLVNWEFVRDCAEVFRKNALKNVLVTNGYVCEEPLSQLLPFIDAANVDVKFFHNDPYRRICKGDLGTVLRNIQEIFSKGVHLEVTFCVIPKENDDEELFKELVEFLYAISPSIPLHISRYFPAYKFHRDPTPLKTLRRFQEIAAKWLNFVYLGNVPENSNTYCPSCKTLLIERRGYSVRNVALDGSRCKKCGEILPFVY